MGDIFLWWLWITILGMLAWPLAFKLFPYLPDRGYALAKPLGLLLVGLTAWALGFWQFTRLAAILAVLFWAVPAFLVWRGARAEMQAQAAQNLGVILVAEFFFAALFLIYLYFRMHVPEIAGTEKYMDMGLLHALARAEILPAQDPWLSGHSIAYYYGGYALLAMLIKLTGTIPAMAYNLSLAMLFALSGLAVFSLIYNLAGRWKIAVAGVGAIFFLGHFAGLAAAWKSPDWLNWDWFQPSRVIPDTINEFPFFSFLLGDLHPHMLAVPFTLLAWNLAWHHFKTPPAEALANSWVSRARFGLWGLVLGSLAFINAWDVPLSAGLALAVICARWKTAGSDAAAWKNPAAALGIMALSAGLPFMPFFLGFHSQFQGLGLTSRSTSLGEFMSIFGFFIFGALLLLFVQGRQFLQKSNLNFSFFEQHRVMALLGAAGLCLALAGAVLKSLVCGFSVLALVIAGFCWTTAEQPATRFNLMLLMAAAALFAGCEIFYIKDAFPPRLHRMNTIFKFYYQAWFLLGVAAVGGWQTAWQNCSGRRVRLVGAGLLMLGAALSLVYPAAAVWARTKGFSSPATLDGSAWLKKSAPGDWAAIEWLRTQVPGRPVVLEAIGPQFSEYARVSVFSGLVSFLGWPGHEVQWRGNYAEIEPRIDAVDRVFFGSENAADSRELLEQYGIDYVFIGRLEQAKYPWAALRKFGLFMDAVYVHPSGTVIFKRKR